MKKKRKKETTYPFCDCGLNKSTVSSLLITNKNVYNRDLFGQLNSEDKLLVGPHVVLEDTPFFHRQNNKALETLLLSLSLALEFITFKDLKEI